MVLLVALGSLFGVLFVPILKSKFKIVQEISGHVYATMISVGISALLSDAVLHLIPEVRLHIYIYIYIPNCTLDT